MIFFVLYHCELNLEFCIVVLAKQPISLFEILCVCLHLCDRATPGSCSSLRRIALTMFPL